MTDASCTQQKIDERAKRAGHRCQVVGPHGDKCNRQVVAVTTVDWVVAVCDFHRDVAANNGFAPRAVTNG